MRTRPNDAEALRLDLEWLEQNAQQAIHEWASDQLLRQALEVAQATKNEEYRAEGLASLASRLKVKLLHEALKVAGRLRTNIRGQKRWLRLPHT